MKKPGWRTVVVVVLVVGFVASKCDNKTTQSAANPAATANSAQPEQASPQKYSAEQRKAAQKAMALVRQDCKVYEEGPHLVVEMKMFITDINARLGYVQAIANSDCVLHGTPRNIYFYDPSGKKIAQADTLNGIRLTD
jgi:hypothetical protein